MEIPHWSAKTERLPRRLLAALGGITLSLLTIMGCNDGPPIPPAGFCLAIREGRWTAYPVKPDGSPRQECIDSDPTIKEIKSQK